MGLRDQFEKLRNYFVEDEDDYDYDDDEAVVEQPIRSEPAPQQIQSRPQPVHQRPVAQTTQSQSFQSRPVQSRSQVTTQTAPAASAVRRTIGSNSGMNTSAYVSSPQPQSTVLSRANSAIATSSSRITMTAPHVYADIMEMGNQLKSGTTLIVNFKNMADQQARRSIDFLTGVAYILDGDIQNIGGQAFLVTPTGVSVEGAKESLLASGGQAFESFDLTSN